MPHRAIPGRAAISMAILGNGDADGSESPRASCPVRDTNDMNYRGAHVAALTRGHVAGPSGLGSSAMILPGRCRPWSRETDVGCRVLAPRLTGKRASMRHDEASQREQVNERTLVGYHELDHRPAFTMAGPVTAAVPPSALQSWQRRFGSGRHGIHPRMSRRGR
jgi:hypothetical protein